MHCNIGRVAKVTKPLPLHEDRLFPAEPTARGVAQRLCREVADLPIPARTVTLTRSGSPSTSVGVDLGALGVGSRSGPSSADPRAAWRLFAERFHLFRGTPSALRLNYVFAKVFELEVSLAADTADYYFNVIVDLAYRLPKRAYKL